MPCTALKITKPDGSIVRVKFMTVATPTHTDVDIYNCNEEFIPIGNPEMGVSPMVEEDYHKKLRAEATERGQYVPEESTDRHWNPGYIEPPEEDENQNQVQS